MSDQMKRIRSPNYPSISLADAVSRLEALFGRIHKHAAPKEAVVKALGYGGWNGASATVVSAFLKFGLLERVGDDTYKITDRSMRILYGRDQAEKAAALKEAAIAPSLYAELSGAFPGDLPHDDILRPWLIRRGFGPSVVSAVIAGYRETMDIVKKSGGGQNHEEPIEEPPMTPASGAANTSPLLPPPSVPSGRSALGIPVPGRLETIMDDDGNSIVVQFPVEPTLETYNFLKEYLEFRITRLRKTAETKIAESDD